jgi:hypothetical protein
MSESNPKEEPTPPKKESPIEEAKGIVRKVLDLTDPSRREGLKAFEQEIEKEGTKLAEALWALSFASDQIDDAFRYLYKRNPKAAEILFKETSFTCIPIVKHRNPVRQEEGELIIESIWPAQRMRMDKEVKTALLGVEAAFDSLKALKDKPKDSWNILDSEIVQIEDTKKRDALIDKIVNLPEDSEEGLAVLMRDWVMLYPEVPESDRGRYRRGIGPICNTLINWAAGSETIRNDEKRIKEKYRKRNSSKEALNEIDRISKSEYKEWKSSWESKRDAEIAKNAISLTEEILLKNIHNYLKDR